MPKKTTRSIFVIAILILTAGALSYFRLLDSYELTLLDLRFKTRPIQKVDSQIVIVEIDNDSLSNLGHWPLPRDYHATLIKVLSQCGVRAIIFDVLFSEPTRYDSLLVEATEEAGCVYYPYALQLSESKDGFWQSKKVDTTLLPALQEAAQGSGHANVLADRDGKRRRIPLFVNYQDKLTPQLSLKVACDYLQIKPEEIKISPRRFVQLAEICRIPIDDEAATLINLAGTWKDVFGHYSYLQILSLYAQAAQVKELPPELAHLKDKICFVGLTATGTADLSASSLEPIYPMIGLHANLLNSILTQSFLRRIGPWVNLGILYLLCGLTIFIVFKFKPLKGILFQLGLLGSFLSTGFLLFILGGLWIDLFYPLVVCISVYLGTNILRYVNELRRREVLEKELSIARNIQRSFLLEVPQQIQGANISVEMDTAHHVGGDLYDFVQFADGKVGLLVGDVSGKGVPAALFMAQIISKFRHFASLFPSPSETLTKLNQDVSRESKSGLFVTMAYCIYYPERAELSFSSAGHLPPLVFRNTAEVEKIEVSEGMPLGLLEEATFEQKQLKLNQGDILLLYTDGVTEARNNKAEEFGEDRVICALQDKKGLSAQQTVQLLKTAVSTFVARTPQHDDITIMALNIGTPLPNSM